MLCYWNELKIHAHQSLVLVGLSWTCSLFEGFFEANHQQIHQVMMSFFELVAKNEVCLVLSEMPEKSYVLAIFNSGRMSRFLSEIDCSIV